MYSSANTALEDGGTVLRVLKFALGNPLYWQTLVRQKLRPFDFQILSIGCPAFYVGILALSAEIFVLFGPIPIESGIF